MATYHSGPALDTELDYRQATLRRAAADHRLARLARRAARTGRGRADRRAAH